MDSLIKLENKKKQLLKKKSKIIKKDSIKAKEGLVTQESNDIGF